MNADEPKKRGRKPQWTDAKVEIMCKAIADGKTFKDAYKAARVSDRAFYNHMKDDVQFIQKVKKAQADFQQWYNSQLVIESKRSLKELVCGFEYEEVTTETTPGKDGKESVTKKKVVTKRVLPNVTAIIFALCNRAPEEWSNKHIQEITGKVETEQKSDISLKNVPDDLLAQVIEAINKK